MQSYSVISRCKGETVKDHSQLVTFSHTVTQYSSHNSYDYRVIFPLQIIKRKEDDTWLVWNLQLFMWSIELVWNIYSAVPSHRSDITKLSKFTSLREVFLQKQFSLAVENERIGFVGIYEYDFFPIIVISVFIKTTRLSL